MRQPSLECGCCTLLYNTEVYYTMPYFRKVNNLKLRVILEIWLRQRKGQVDTVRSKWFVVKTCEWNRNKAERTPSDTLANNKYYYLLAIMTMKGCRVQLALSHHFQ